MSDKPTERAPLLSDASFKAMCDTGDGTVSFETGSKMREVRDFYEAKRASGELITKEEHERSLEEEKDRWEESRAWEEDEY